MLQYSLVFAGYRSLIMIEKNTYIKNAIDAQIKNETVSFHMPGHKGTGPQLTYQQDLTELAETDNLHFPKGAIKEALRQCSEIFGAQKSYFLINGSSCGITASILSLPEGSRILLPRNAHISAYYGCILKGLNPIYYYPKNIYQGITLEDIKQALAVHSGVDCVFVVNPTYYGCCCDIRKIASYVHHLGKVLIVDEAHGTHFALSEEYPCSALEAGADLVIHSGHKNIGGLTQTGILHINSSRIECDAVENALRMVQSTSPSYLLMCSLEQAVLEASEKQGVMKQIKDDYDIFSRKLMAHSPFYVENFCLKKCNKIHNSDPFKLWIVTTDSGYSGTEIYRMLAQKGIVLEGCDANSILALGGFHSCRQDYEALLKALCNIPLKEKSVGGSVLTELSLPQANVVMSMTEAMEKPAESRCCDQAIGQICADFLIPYPPGIPVAVPGEVYTDEIHQYLHQSDEVLGINKGIMRVLTEKRALS